MLKKLLHTRYRVSDLEKTVHFYKEVLGLEEVRRHTSPARLAASLLQGSGERGGDRDLQIRRERPGAGRLRHDASCF
jgi:catechol 2,3-dioxygenase-like lactoylglutathione lyase family enzyme